MTPCCCIPTHTPSKSPSLPVKVREIFSVKNLERVSAVALCIFAAYMNFTCFVASLLAGALYQVIKMAYQIKQNKLGEQRPGCGQGFGELISQLKLLSPEIVLATAYVAWRHLVHDPKGFVPFVGFFVGMGLAYRAVCYIQRGQTPGLNPNN